MSKIFCKDVSAVVFCFEESAIASWKEYKSLFRYLVKELGLTDMGK